MMRKRRLFKSVGQSTTEYAVLLAVVAAALIGMQAYMKRGIQGRLRNLADQVSPTQYEQGRTTSSYATTQNGTTVQQYVNGIASTYQDPLADLDGDGVPDASEAVPEQITRSGYEEVHPEEQ